MTHKPIVAIAISTALAEEIKIAPYLPAIAEYAHLEQWAMPGQPTADWVADALQRAQVIVTGWGIPSLIEPLANWNPAAFPLRLVAHSAGSIKSLVPAGAMERGLIVTHANESLAEAVAEFTFGAFFAMRRQMILSGERFRNGQPNLAFTTMRELPGSVIGIIGASAIGKRVMEMLRPWQVEILIYDPYCSAETAAHYNARLVDLDTLMRNSDIVSLHAPITPETINMLRGEHFAAMKDGAVFINTARGVLVDHDALLKELSTGRIYAMLDVTDPKEPLPRDSAFYQLENCVLLPHMAGNSVEARTRQGRYAAEDVLHYLKGEPLRFPVQVTRWNSMA